MYYLTESAAFMPPMLTVEVHRKVYRLACLSSTTPAELFRRKVDLEEYGEALALARAWKLSADLVYQRQWVRRPVSKFSIKDLLANVQDRHWQLEQCLTRIPDDSESLLLLLEYGLSITDVMRSEVNAAAKAKRSETGSGSNSLVDDQGSDEHDDDDEEEEEEEEEEDVAGVNDGLAAMYNLPADEFSAAQRVACAERAERLSPGELLLVRYRLIFLHFMDRLRTYSAICKKTGVPFEEHGFREFRACDLLAFAAEQLSRENFNVVDLLFTYHGATLLPHWLPLLCEIPATTKPSAFEDLLPALAEDADVAEPAASSALSRLSGKSLSDSYSDSSHVLEHWECQRWREKMDWCELGAVLDVIGGRMQPAVSGDASASQSTTGFGVEGSSMMNFVEVLSKLFSRGGADVRSFYSIAGPGGSDSATTRSASPTAGHGAGASAGGGVPLSSWHAYRYPVSDGRLTQWFLTRARDIEMQSGMVDNARSFVAGGRERGVRGLDGIFDSLLSMCDLVYGGCVEDSQSKGAHGSAGGRDAGSLEDDELVLSSRRLASLTLAQWEAYTDAQRLRLLMSATTTDTVVARMREKGLPFVLRAISREQAADREEADGAAVLLRDYLVWLSRERLEQASLIIQCSKPNLLVQERIIRDDEQLVETALACVYACKSGGTDVLDVSNDIFESLPPRDAMLSGAPAYHKLHDRVDALDRHLYACEVLARSGVNLPLSHFQECEQGTGAVLSSKPWL